MMNLLRVNVITVIRYFIIIILSWKVLSDNCKIPWIESGHQVAVSDYVVRLSVINTVDDLRTYFPNTFYDITIRSKFNNRTFSHFYFAMKNENKTKSYGNLELRDSRLARFHNAEYCINRIIDGSGSVAKVNVTIGWQSPPVDSGCIELRAVVKETDSRYHVSNITVCQDERVHLDDPGEILKNCCACDAGKYELSFEGRWSKYTHSKNFPKREWLAVFPTIIGASHTHYYEFWHPYTNASNGLQKFATTGNSIDLELELKRNWQNISTLIKFRGTNFQNKTRKSFAGVRVDKENHVVSLVARIDPSPDWFIGVSSLELCKSDCTWIASKTLNLYPYDAGVREGLSYEDTDRMTEPQDIIQKLNMSWPPPRDNVESPFFDKNNNTHDVRPLAIINLRRLKGSEKSCEKTFIPEDCFKPWSQWSPCSVTCGVGFKTRTRVVDLEKYSESECQAIKKESVSCNINVTCEIQITEAECDLTEWGPWRKCNKPCGLESTHRERTYKLREYSGVCDKNFPNKMLVEKKDCGNPPCPSMDFTCNDALYTDWSSSSVCHSNGIYLGVRVKYRKFRDNYKKFLYGHSVDAVNIAQDSTDYGYHSCFYERDACSLTEDLNIKNIPPEPPVPDQVEKPHDHEKEEESKADGKDRPGFCYLPAEEGKCLQKREKEDMFYYNHNNRTCLKFSYSGCGGNKNRFTEEKLCKDECIIYGRTINCKLSEWTNWSKCNKCIQSRKRFVLEPAVNNGTCPVKMYDLQKCPCKNEK